MWLKQRIAPCTGGNDNLVGSNVAGRCINANNPSSALHQSRYRPTCIDLDAPFVELIC